MKAWIYKNWAHLAGWGMAIALFLALFLCMGCESQDYAAQRDKERGEVIVRAVEDYAAGRIGPDETLLIVLREYGKSIADHPSGGSDVWEILGLAVGTAIPAAAGAVGLVNKRRNASRAAELAARDEAQAQLQEAIRNLEAKVAAPKA